MWRQLFYLLQYEASYIICNAKPTVWPAAMCDVKPIVLPAIWNHLPAAMWSQYLTCNMCNVKPIVLPAMWSQFKSLPGMWSLLSGDLQCEANCLTCCNVKPIVLPAMWSPRTHPGSPCWGRGFAASHYLPGETWCSDLTVVLSGPPLQWADTSDSSGTVEEGTTDYRNTLYHNYYQYTVSETS